MQSILQLANVQLTLLDFSFLPSCGSGKQNLESFIFFWKFPTWYNGLSIIALELSTWPESQCLDLNPRLNIWVCLDNQSVYASVSMLLIWKNDSMRMSWNCPENSWCNKWKGLECGLPCSYTFYNYCMHKDTKTCFYTEHMYINSIRCLWWNQKYS